jgi:hypothetical protein
MTTDFKKRGITVPQNVLDDLKSAKTMLRVLKADTTQGETLQKIDAFLGSVESYLVSEGEKLFGEQYSKQWLKRIDQAGRRKPEEEEQEERFVAGLLPGKQWIRIKSSKELPSDKLKKLVEASGLSYKVQADDFFLIYGEDPKLKDLVKKMAKKTSGGQTD